MASTKGPEHPRREFLPTGARRRSRALSQELSRWVLGEQFVLSLTKDVTEFFAFVRAAHHLAHFDGLAPSNPSGPRRRRSTRRDLIRLFRAFHINDPISREELFGFREDSVGNWRPVACGANDLGMVGECQAHRRNEGTDSSSSC
jgi:hypothetical protein